MNATEKLLKRLPKKYHPYVLELDGPYEKGVLIDDCKYMLLMQDGCLLFGELDNYPCLSIKEAIDIIKEGV